MMRTIGIAAGVIVIVGVLLGAGYWYTGKNASAAVAYRTAPMTRGDIISTIAATGTLEPEEVIDVGAQVAGRITEFGKDKEGKTIDYGSHVEAGTVLALIDPSVYQSQVDQAEAQLASAKAGIARAQADVGQYTAKYKQAERDWNRAQKIGPSDALAQMDYDQYQSTYESSKANVAVGEAALEQARRAVTSSEAQLKLARQNLGYCTIISPVKGVIIDRRVNIGQTVVASLSAPSLFLLAKDLTRMQVWIAVNEADVGSIKPGQRVTFTVDAFPGKSFEGKVSKVRLNASMTQNVVTYTVEVTTDNSNGLLLPYLTASAQFEVDHREDVMTVPNAALRWTPTNDQIAPDARDEYAQMASGGGRKRGGGADASSKPTTRRASSRPSNRTSEPEIRFVWTKDGEYVRPIRVHAGATDGANTEISGKDLEEGIEVVIGEAAPANASRGGGAAAGGSTNPFAPSFPGGRGGGGRR